MPVGMLGGCPEAEGARKYPKNQVVLKGSNEFIGGSL